MNEFVKAAQETERHTQEMKGEIERHTQEMKGLVESIKSHIRSLPDNPRISRLGSSCFTVSSKDFGKNWTPEYHDFKRQYEMVVEALEKTNPDNIVNCLRQIVEDGKLRVGSYKNTQTLHPDVVGYLKGLLP